MQSHMRLLNLRQAVSMAAIGKERLNLTRNLTTLNISIIQSSLCTSQQSSQSSFVLQHVPNLNRLARYEN